MNPARLLRPNLPYPTARSRPLRLPRARFAIACLAVATATGFAATTTPKEDRSKIEVAELKEAFLPFTELEPFVVEGEDLSISVYARSRGDRRYAERFAESVVEIAYETIGKSTGHGLVIVGNAGEPHPIFVFRHFLEMHAAGQLDGELAEAAVALTTQLDQWKAGIKIEDGGDNGMDLDFETIVKALPLPLEGVASQLYLVAWLEKFDEPSLQKRLTSLTAADLSANELAKYDWVFYLPPRNAFHQVIKEVLPKAMKQAELGFFKRVAIRGALVTFRPLVNDAIEGLRKGVLFFTVLHARSGYEKADIQQLTEAYVGAMMPHGKILPGKKQERAREAIEAQKLENIEYAKNPFVAPEPLEDPDLAAYQRFVGEYGRGKKPTHRFAVTDGVCTWQYLDWKPGVFHPAGDALFVSEDGKMTIEFIVDEEGKVLRIEERWERRHVTVPGRS